MDGLRVRIRGFRELDGRLSPPAEPGKRGRSAPTGFSESSVREAWGRDYIAKQKKVDLEDATSQEIASHGNRVLAVAMDPTGTIAVTGDRDGVGAGRPHQRRGAAPSPRPSAHDRASTGYQLHYAPFPGWKTVPQW